MRFMKRPVIVEAVQYHGTGEIEGPPWIGEAIQAGVLISTDSGQLGVHTLEGIMFVSPGDWIIRGIRGELYPCKPDIFSETYQEVI